MTEFKAIVANLKVKDVRFIPGENDAGSIMARCTRLWFGVSNYSFDHKGVHFVALDNVSDPNGLIGEIQLQWLHDDLARHDKAQPIVVFAHRPYSTSILHGTGRPMMVQGDRHPDALRECDGFYGHIHQEHHQMTGKSLITR